MYVSWNSSNSVTLKTLFIAAEKILYFQYLGWYLVAYIIRCNLWVVFSEHYKIIGKKLKTNNEKREYLRNIDFQRNRFWIFVVIKNKWMQILEIFLLLCIILWYHFQNIFHFSELFLDISQKIDTRSLSKLFLQQLKKNVLFISNLTSHSLYNLTQRRFREYGLVTLETYTSAPLCCTDFSDFFKTVIIFYSPLRYNV